METDTLLHAPVGVVIPAYNRAHLITQTLDTVRLQELPPQRVVVIDDGSSDNTGEVVDQWRQQYELPFEFVYQFQNNKGVGAARNTGLALVEDCDWVAFLDSDDLWPVDLLARLHQEVQRHPQYIACSAETEECFFDLEHRLQGSRRYSHKNGYGKHGPEGIMAAPPHICATIVRSEIALRTGGFDPKLRYGEDKLYLMSASCHGPWGRIDGEPITYRCFLKSLDTNQLTRNPHQNSRIRYAILLDRQLTPFIKSAEPWHKGIRWATWKAWHRAGKQLEKSGHLSWAAHFYYRAAARRPWGKSILRALLIYLKMARRALPAQR